jgi:hypothetical protein
VLAAARESDGGLVEFLLETRDLEPLGMKFLTPDGRRELYLSQPSHNELSHQSHKQLYRT